MPAAIAAPTPVSALVHSSTLVTAGVYLIIRFNKLFDLKLIKLLFLLGCFTIIIARFSAFYETDIKKIIALSTLSQLGLMFTGIGIQQFELAYFHLLTHAYFKAIIFIAVGRIIHLNSRLQDLRLTGINQNNLGPTLSVVRVANLRLIGFPYLSGFYSKDLIIETCLIINLRRCEILLILRSISLTAAYAIRFLILTN